MGKENMDKSIDELDDDDYAVNSAVRAVRDWRDENCWKMRLEKIEKYKHLFPEDKYNQVIEKIKREHDA